MLVCAAAVARVHRVEREAGMECDVHLGDVASVRPAAVLLRPAW